MAPSEYRSRTAGLNFRQAVTFFLNLRGLPVERRPDIRSLAEAMRDDPPMSDLLGLDGWTVALRARTGSRDLSGDLARGRAAAAHDGVDRFCTIYSPRGGADLRDSLVVTDLKTWSDLIAEGQCPLAPD